MLVFSSWTLLLYHTKLKQKSKIKEKGELTQQRQTAESLTNNNIDKNGMIRYSVRRQGYDPYTTLAMQWVNFTPTRPGIYKIILNIFSRRFR